MIHISSYLYDEFKASNFLPKFPKTIITKNDLTNHYNDYVDNHDKKTDGLFKQKNPFVFINVVECFLLNFVEEVLHNFLSLPQDDEHTFNQKHLYEHIIDNYYDIEDIWIENIQMNLQKLLEVSNMTYVNKNKQLIKDIMRNCSEILNYSYLPIPIKWEINDINVNNINKERLGDLNDIYKYGLTLHLSTVHIHVDDLNIHNISTICDFISNSTKSAMSQNVEEIFEIRSLGE